MHRALKPHTLVSKYAAIIKSRDFDIATPENAALLNVIGYE